MSRSHQSSESFSRVSNAAQLAPHDLQAARPVALEVQVEAIPQELRRERRFVCWRYEYNRGRNAWDKIPYQPNGTRARTNDSRTWTDFETAFSTYRRSLSGPGEAFSGIGFVLGDGWAGVDLDDCRAPDTQTLTPEALEITGSLRSYTEISPSGTGVKIFVRGSLPQIGRRRAWVEMYDRGQFFVVTGAHVAGTASTVEERTPQLRAVHTKWLKNGSDHPERRIVRRRDCRLRGGHLLSDGAGAIDDDAVLSLARRARNGEKFSRLFAGDFSGHPTHSEADLALIRMLYFWTGGHGVQMDRLFRQSGLYRQKWDERHGQHMYGAITIDKVIATGGPVYCGTSADNSTVLETVASIFVAAPERLAKRTQGSDWSVLKAFTNFALQYGVIEFGASFRWIAEHAGIALQTAYDSTVRLAEHRFLVKLDPPSSAETTTTRWRLASPSNDSAEARTVSLHAKEPKKTVLIGGVAAHVVRLSPADPAHDVWRRQGGLGKVKILHLRRSRRRADASSGALQEARDAEARRGKAPS
jgi:hypothetical protein